MAISTLVDTNIFLEILLNQKRKEDCKAFLQDHSQSIAISDFSLHSIGVIVFRNNKNALFGRFCNDVLSQMKLLSLPDDEYGSLAKVSNTFDLDFDDTYQLLLATINDLKIVTMDQDFKTVKPDQVSFI